MKDSFIYVTKHKYIISEDEEELNKIVLRDIEDLEIYIKEIASYDFLIDENGFVYDENEKVYKEICIRRIG